jgi:hypothetical protein
MKLYKFGGRWAEQTPYGLTNGKKHTKSIFAAHSYAITIIYNK